MATGLKCLIKNSGVISRIKQTMLDVSNMTISANPSAKITAKDLYNQMKAAGIDIDLQSTAAIYSDAFAASIDVHNNFETSEELAAYKSKTAPVNTAVKNALIKSGFGKTLSNGKQILDWVKLMRKTHDEIKSEIKQAIKDNAAPGTSVADIQSEIDSIFDDLKGSWKQIISNAIVKSQNSLKKRDTPVDSSQKNAIDKVSDLYAEGLFDEFKDDYKTALRKAVGVSASNREAMVEIDGVAKAANALANSNYGANNFYGQELESEMNKIIAKARYKEGGWVYRRMRNLSNIFDFVLLKNLNNPFNRSQNYLSGQVGKLNTRIGYGKLDKEINGTNFFGGGRGLANATKRNIIRDGGVDHGEVNSMLHGNSQATDEVRQKINNAITKGGDSKLVNWAYSQLMGTAALNAVDSGNKVSMVWARFISGMEDILVSKGESRADVRERLHKEMFGKGVWDNARVKAEELMQHINSKGGTIKINDQTIQRFAADIVKAELVQNGVIKANEMKAAWNAGYRAAGREMGHVPNNPFSAALNSQKIATAKKIDDATKAKKYPKAANLILQDLIVNKIAWRFASGGTNWIILKLSKGGLGIVTGSIMRMKNNSSFKDIKHLSDMTTKEIEDTLYDVQRTKDEFTRGLIGGITNAALFTIFAMAMRDDDDKDRLLKFLEKHYVVNKAINAIIPFWISAYIAKMQQDNIGYDMLDNKYKKQPIVDYTLNLANQNTEFAFSTQFLKSLQYFSSGKDEKATEKKQLNGAEAAGKMVGNYFDLNPMPTKLLYDGINIYNEIYGDSKYVRPNYETNKEAFVRGILKYGIFGKVVDNELKSTNDE